MKKTNESHSVHIVLRDWTKAHKADAHVVAEKIERIPSLSVLPTKQTEIKCTRQAYILPH